MGLGVFHRLIVSPLILLPPLVYAGGFHPHRYDFLPWGVRLILILVALDFSNFVGHWLGHKVSFLWRFHSVHHLDNHLDATTGFRVHAVEKIFFLPGKFAIVFALGAGTADLAMIETIGLCHAIFHHANIRLPERFEDWLSVFLTTPSSHRVHHHAELPYTDSNYGFIFSFWDRAFGTLRVNRMSRPIFGVNQRSQGAISENFSELFCEPFIHSISGTTTGENNAYSES